MMLKGVWVDRLHVMRPSTYRSTTYHQPTQVTARSLLVAYALAALFPVAFYALDNPLAVATVAGLGVAALAFRAGMPTRTPRRVCVPGTGVCIEA